MAHATLAHAIMAHVIMAQFTIKCHNGALTECRIVKFSSHYDTLVHAFTMAHCYKIDSVWRIVLRWRITSLSPFPTPLAYSAGEELYWHPILT